MALPRISTTLLFFGAAVAASFTGSLIDLGGGFESESGYLTVFYLMSALSFAAGIMYLFARETAGVRHRRRSPHPEENRVTPIP